MNLNYTCSLCGMPATEHLCESCTKLASDSLTCDDAREMARQALAKQNPYCESCQLVAERKMTCCAFHFIDLYNI